MSGSLDAARERLAVALDVSSAAEAVSLLNSLGDQCRWVKVGMELFYAEGPGVIDLLRKRDLEVFLDLKLHDIPNTVAQAIRSLSKLDVRLLTLHAQGGADMLRAAQEATLACGGPKLLAVTVLTSLDKAALSQVGVNSEPADQVLRLSQVATTAGVHGLVCSPLETRFIRESLGSAPFLVTPGIRSANAEGDDQRRTSSVEGALKDGSSMLVIGRPITRAGNPAAALNTFLSQIESASVK